MLALDLAELQELRTRRQFLLQAVEDFRLAQRLRELEVLALIAKDFGLAVNPAEALIERQGIFGNGKKLIDLV